MCTTPASCSPADWPAEGLDSRIAQKAGVARGVAEQPEDCVALGTAKASRYVKIMSTGVYDINQFSYRLSDMDV